MESPIKVDKELEAAVNACTSPEQIVQLMHEKAVSDGLLPKEVLGFRENWNPKAAVTAPTKKFERRENIGGRDFNFSAGSEAELQKLIADARVIAEAVQPRDEQGRFVSPQDQGRIDEEKARRAELEADFRAGRISADQYLEQSGAVAEFLIARDIPLEAIQETVAAAERKTWEQASAAFAHGDGGADWPGGQRNLEILAMTVTALGLANTDEPLEALKAAWKQMKKDGVIFKEDGSPAAATAGTGSNEVTEEDFANATSYEELRQLARRAAGQDPTDAASPTAYMGR